MLSIAAAAGMLSLSNTSFATSSGPGTILVLDLNGSIANRGTCVQTISPSLPGNNRACVYGDNRLYNELNALLLQAYIFGRRISVAWPQGFFIIDQAALLSGCNQKPQKCWAIGNGDRLLICSRATAVSEASGPLISLFLLDEFPHLVHDPVYNGRIRRDGLTHLDVRRLKSRERRARDELVGSRGRMDIIPKKV